uniref:Uncharacterized protein n=1 Tax=Plectus sambesii TaxID=2011161 RepID=A0A914W3D7_9BILA
MVLNKSVRIADRLLVELNPEMPITMALTTATILFLVNDSRHCHFRQVISATDGTIKKEAAECKGHELLIGAASHFLQGKDIHSRALDNVAAEMSRGGRRRAIGDGR